jgi:hypothetical protein
VNGVLSYQHKSSDFTYSGLFVLGWVVSINHNIPDKYIPESYNYIWQIKNIYDIDWTDIPNETDISYKIPYVQTDYNKSLRAKITLGLNRCEKITIYTQSNNIKSLFELNDSTIQFTEFANIDINIYKNITFDVEITNNVGLSDTKQVSVNLSPSSIILDNNHIESDIKGIFISKINVLDAYSLENRNSFTITGVAADNFLIINDSLYLNKNVSYSNGDIIENISIETTNNGGEIITQSFNFYSSKTIQDVVVQKNKYKPHPNVVSEIRFDTSRSERIRRQLNVAGKGTTNKHIPYTINKYSNGDIIENVSIETTNNGGEIITQSFNIDSSQTVQDVVVQQNKYTPRTNVVSEIQFDTSRSERIRRQITSAGQRIVTVIQNPTPFTISNF